MPCSTGRVCDMAQFMGFMGGEWNDKTRKTYGLYRFEYFYLELSFLTKKGGSPGSPGLPPSIHPHECLEVVLAALV
ncbi:MAG: hypothetical protein MJA30_07505, partial [Cytophagales bacterium]|nr:hypothetical protein [Cytophagales bacterium]